MRCFFSYFDDGFEFFNCFYFEYVYWKDLFSYYYEFFKFFVEVGFCFLKNLNVVVELILKVFKFLKKFYVEFLKIVEKKKKCEILIYVLKIN